MRLSRLLPVVLGVLAATATFSGGAAAGPPGFALFDVHSDLAAASHNAFGDVKVWKRQAALASRAHGATLVRCGSDCTFGPGWLAFSRPPTLSAADVLSAKARRSTFGWGVVVTLTSRGKTSLARFHRRASLSGKTRGVPDALVLVLDGTIVAQPLANQIVTNQIATGKPTLELPGFSRANALRAAKLLNR